MRCLEVIHGAMFAGKSTALIERLRQCQDRASRAAFKHELDRRYSNSCIASHDGDTFHARPIRSGAELLRYAPPEGFIVCDEFHLFGDDFVPAVTELLLDMRCHVIVAGLTYRMDGVMYPMTKTLAAMADREIILRAPCRECGDRTLLNQKMTRFDGNLIGGKDDFEPRCAAHFSPTSMVVDDNPELETPVYGHGAVFECHDGRMAVLLAVTHGQPYVVLESTGETFLMVGRPTAPTLLTKEQICGENNGRWDKTNQPFVLSNKTKGGPQHAHVHGMPAND